VKSQRKLRIGPRVINIWSKKN